MSHRGTFEFKNREYTLLDFSYSFQRRIDHNGRPASEPSVGQFYVTVESAGNSDLAAWAMFSSTPESGVIVLKKRDQESTFLRYTFRDAYCIEFEERFNANSAESMQIRMFISANEIEIEPGGVWHSNLWSS